MPKAVLEMLPAEIVRAALNECTFLPGVFEADVEPKADESGRAVGFITNDEGDQIKITAEYVEEQG